MSVVSSSRPLESEPQQPAVDRIDLSEPKVQIDPTLIEPLVPLPAEAAPAPVRASSSQPAMDPPMAASSSNGMRLQQLLTPVPGFQPPYPTYPADPGQAAAAPGF